MMIEHLAAPRFTARWTTGDFPIESLSEAAFFWTDEGGAPEDSIHLYDFAWGQRSDHREMQTLMAKAIEAIERHIMSGA